MTPLRTIEAHLTAELERLRAGGESCEECGLTHNPGKRWDFSVLPEVLVDCPDCNGTGRSPAITAAESALNLCREERRRVERLVELDWNAIGNAVIYVMLYHTSQLSREHAKELSLQIREALAEYNAPVKESSE